MNGYAKLRLSPREMIPGKYVSRTLTKKDIEAIRKELEDNTRESFETFDRMKRQTWYEADKIIFD